MPAFVQFLHSRREYSITPSEKRKGVIEWNYGEHRRKFLKAQGHYVDTSYSVVGPSELVFWGEWEPESKLTPLKSGWLHEPNLRLDSAGHVVAVATKTVNGTVAYRQNTDPFVFNDDGFLFSCCHQSRKCRPTRLQSLDPGSIVVFGSCIDNQFAVDTVLVIKEFKDYTASSIAKDLNGFVWNSQLYEEILGQGLCASSPTLCASMPRYRCYKGATPYTKVNEMFSFVPCKVAGNPINSFDRPVLSSAALNGLPLSVNPAGLVIDTLRQNYHITDGLTPSDMKQIWDKLYNVLLNNPTNLLLPGTRFYY